MSDVLGVQFASTERLGSVCSSCGGRIQRMRSSSVATGDEGRIAFTAHEQPPSTPHRPVSAHDPKQSANIRSNKVVRL